MKDRTFGELLWRPAASQGSPIGAWARSSSTVTPRLSALASSNRAERSVEVRPGPQSVYEQAFGGQLKIKPLCQTGYAGAVCVGEDEILNRLFDRGDEVDDVPPPRSSCRLASRGRAGPRSLGSVRRRPANTRPRRCRRLQQGASGVCRQNTLHERPNVACPAQVGHL